MNDKSLFWLIHSLNICTLKTRVALHKADRHEPCQSEPHGRHAKTSFFERANDVIVDKQIGNLLARTDGTLKRLPN